PASCSWIVRLVPHRPNDLDGVADPRRLRVVDRIDDEVRRRRQIENDWLSARRRIVLLCCSFEHPALAAAAERIGDDEQVIRADQIAWQAKMAGDRILLSRGKSAGVIE